jgi:hypothetical protein
MTSDEPRAPFTLLVNSSDGFEDCWEPFFTLLERYWKGLRAPILLNTERKDWRPATGLPVKCTRVQPADAPRLTWSECLLRALDQVKTPLVLYMQEDYFLDRPVNEVLIDEVAALMLSEPEIRHVGLTHFGSHGPFQPWSADARLWQIGKRARYRISTQAGLWRVETLRSYIHPDENGWMFELLGTWRARRREETFLTVARDQFGPSRVPTINYTHTGIIKGRWHPEMPSLFAREGISMDFGRRGMYVAKPAFVRRWETARKLAANPGAVLRALQ